MIQAHPALSAHPLYRELRDIIARLELKSHVSAMRLEPSSRDSGGDIGGNRPPGGASRMDDREIGWTLKSAEYFKRRLAWCVKDGRVVEPVLRALLAEAHACERAWLYTPTPPDAEPEHGSFLWKCRIADDDRPWETVRAYYSVSRATIYRYRAKYRGLRKSSCP